jgi:hypothetical protein
LPIGNIKQRKQTLINKNNKKENQKRIDYNHAIRELIMKIKARILKMEQPREGPFEKLGPWIVFNCLDC